jgi:hypothetical protein
MSIINFYKLKGVQEFMPKNINPNYDCHKIKVPMCGLVCGCSGAGKSNFILGLISLMPDTFNHVYIYTMATEPLYEYLQSRFDDDLLTVRYGIEEFTKFDEADYSGQSLVVFDDFCNYSEKQQTEISNLYIRGRKIASGVSMLYLTQAYYKVPKVIRGQCNYIFILKVQQLRDLRMILSEFALGATVQEIQALYKKCCVNNDITSFLTIDLQGPQELTFRHNFTAIGNNGLVI